MQNEKKLKTIELFEKCIPIFEALGDKVRQQLILEIANSEDFTLNVSELTARTSLSRPAISHHLKVLKNAGIIRPEKKSTQIFYVLNYMEKVNVVKELVKAMEEFHSK